MNKMILVVVPRDRAEAVINALVAAGHTTTVADSRGGVLRQAQQMLYIAVPKEALDEVLELIRTHCRTALRITEGGSATQHEQSYTVELGGAVIFVWDLERFEVIGPGREPAVTVSAP